MRAHKYRNNYYNEYDKKIHYASIIQILQRELDAEVSSFTQLGLMASDDYNDKEEYNYNNKYTA
jgi:hypothetical protein